MAAITETPVTCKMIPLTAEPLPSPILFGRITGLNSTHGQISCHVSTQELLDQINDGRLFLGTTFKLPLSVKPLYLTARVKKIQTAPVTPDNYYLDIEFFDVSNEIQSDLKNAAVKTPAFRETGEFFSNGHKQRETKTSFIKKKDAEADRKKTDFFLGKP